MTTKILGVGDVHYRAKNPVNRIDDYSEAILTKLREIVQLTKLYQVDAVVFTGDIFHTPVTSVTELVAVAAVFDKIDVPIIIVPGNHDIYGYNIDSLSRTHLSLLSLINKNVIILKEGYLFQLGDFIITGQHYSGSVDVDGYGYDCFKHEEDCNLWNTHVHLHVVHGMLLDHKPVFDKYTLIKDVKTTADIIFSGHYHPGFNATVVNDVTFINSGAICRESATEAEMTRMIGVTLFEATEHKYKHTFIPLLTAKPGHEVLSRAAIEQKQETTFILDEFNTLLKNQRTGIMHTNILDMIKDVAKSSKIDPVVCRTAVKLVEEKQIFLANKKEKS